jgi:hypothetical protein
MAPRSIALAAACGFGLAALAAAAPGEERRDPPPSQQQEAETLKERLSDKASDEQRVDNCNVPPEKRGKKQRPDGCPARTSAALPK